MLALPALSALLIFLKAKRASWTPASAHRTHRRNPVVIAPAMLAPTTDWHTSRLYQKPPHPATCPNRRSRSPTRTRNQRPNDPSNPRPSPPPPCKFDACCSRGRSTFFCIFNASHLNPLPPIFCISDAPHGTLRGVCFRTSASRPSRQYVSHQSSRPIGARIATASASSKRARGRKSLRTFLSFVVARAGVRSDQARERSAIRRIQFPRSSKH
jgi:hypothetical protein